MKKSAIFLFFTLLMISSSLCVTAEAINVSGPSKQKNLFTFKTEKEFVGARVEVYNSSGWLVASQSLQKRKMVIDFGDAKFGMYTIRITKGNSRQEFRYIKK